MHKLAESKMIPRVLHQIWMQGVEKVPQKYDAQRAAWKRLHPNWQFKLWDEATIVQKLHGTPWLEVAHGLSLIQRADIYRCGILEAEGGVYADLDMEALKPIDSILIDGRICVGGSHSSSIRVQNSIIAAPPGHRAWRTRVLPAFRRGLAAQSLIDQCSSALHVLRSTGPMAWTRALDETFHIWPAEYFFSLRVPKCTQLTAIDRETLKESYGYHAQDVSWMDASLDSIVIKSYTAWTQLNAMSKFYMLLMLLLIIC